jgi:hypothetical protein
MSPTAPTAYGLQRVVSAAMQTLEMLRTEHGLVVETDDELLAALADEQVDIPRVLTLLLRGAAEAASLAEGAKARIADQRQRMERFARDQQSKRDLAQQVMEAVGLKSFKCAEATASLSVGPTKVIVTEPDPKRLPDQWVTITVTRTPDKAAIRSAIEDRQALIKIMRERGEEPPPELEGAVLSNGGSVLTVRSK